MKIEQTRKTVRQALHELAEALEAGKSETLMAYLRAMARFHRYSAGNILLIALQRPDAEQVAGYRAWQKLHRFVRQGEKGIAIMAPIIRRSQHVDRDKDEEEPVAFKTAYVFDINQTEGQPLPEFAQMRGDPGHYLQALRGFVSDRQVQLKYVRLPGTTQGYSAKGAIAIREGLPTAEEFSVLVHELAHVMLHSGQNGCNKSVLETEAEAVAYVVCQGIGLDTNGSCCDYIKLYDGKKETLMESLERIQKVATEIIAGIAPGRQEPEIANAIHDTASALAA